MSIYSRILQILWSEQYQNRIYYDFALWKRHLVNPGYVAVGYTDLLYTILQNYEYKTKTKYNEVCIEKIARS